MADVCIVGAGPAGLVVASELAGRGFDVHLLESGTDSPGLGPEDVSGLVDGDPIYGLDLGATRRRGIGGSAGLWAVKTDRRRRGWNIGVRYAVLTDLATGDRPWMSHSSWPLDRDVLDHWYRRAHDLLVLGPFGYEPDGRPAGDLSLLDSPDFERRQYRFGHRSRFLVDLRSQLERAPDVTLEPAATVTQLHRSDGTGPIDRVSYVTADGARHQLRARVFVLAGGGIENARLLLDSEAERGGIGNELDHVGRYFADHPLFAVGEFQLRDRHRLSAFTFFDLAWRDDAPRHGHLVTSRSWCEENEAVEIAVSFFPRPPRPMVESIEAVKMAVQNRRQLLADPGLVGTVVKRGGTALRHLPWAVRTSVLQRQSLLPGFGRGGWSDDVAAARFSELELVFQCEQPPMRESRVTLSDERDRFGGRKPRVTWRLGDQTRRSVLVLQRSIVETLAPAIGPYRPRAGSLDQLNPPASIAHHLGTTRMSRSPKTGVVDPDCRVHSCPNLFVAGSSVFPTSGYANPTLTIAALSLRLAETIARELRPAPVVDRRDQALTDGER